MANVLTAGGEAPQILRYGLNGLAAAAVHYASWSRASAC